MPLLHGHEHELAADAERLLASGVCTDIAVMMTLVPESDPPVDKARILGDCFLAFRESFKGDPARLGILAQATIGHGWAPDEPASYQKITSPSAITASEMITPEGGWQDVAYANGGLQVPLLPAEPKVFRITNCG